MYVNYHLYRKRCDVTIRPIPFKVQRKRRSKTLYCQFHTSSNEHLSAMHASVNFDIRTASMQCLKAKVARIRSKTTCCVYAAAEVPPREKRKLLELSRSRNLAQSLFLAKRLVKPGTASSVRLPGSDTIPSIVANL